MANAQSAAQKVLVVEDDKFLAKVLDAKLKKEGFEVILAVDGDEALAKARDEKPAIILLDLIIPKKNGFDVLAELRKETAFAHLPILILSNLGQDTDVQKGMSLGASDYIVKANISIEDVVVKMRQYLQ